MEDLAPAININGVERHMLSQEQVDCPVLHHFGPGIYIREVTLPAGIIAIGHKQRKSHLNVMISGKVAVLDNNEMKILEAPLTFTGRPGKKVGYVIEECVWQNIYATHETDIDKLESIFLEKSDASMAEEESKRVHEWIEIQKDREDFHLMCAQYKLDKNVVRAQSENTDDMVDLKGVWKSAVSVRDSNIEGKGLFLTFPAEGGHVIIPARIDGKRTIGGRYVNHSRNPNCEFVDVGQGDIVLVAKHQIPGCVGGNKGTELTVDYRQALSLSGIEAKTCQE